MRTLAHCFWFSLLLALATSCTRHHRGHSPVAPVTSRLVSIQVEVYDPVSNYVWENVGVRVVRATQEWSNCICENPDPDQWYLTDASGLVLFDALRLGNADVGFVRDAYGRALLESHPDRDEADVLLEVWSPGFTSVFVQVPLRWNRPHMFVSIPFH